MGSCKKEDMIVNKTTPHKGSNDTEINRLSTNARFTYKDSLLFHVSKDLPYL